jgi:hypothetical protein
MPAALTAALPEQFRVKADSDLYGYGAHLDRIPAPYGEKPADIGLPGND